jgi:hypothetical protein
MREPVVRRIGRYHVHGINAESSLLGVVMFLRFTVSERDSNSQTWKGLFTAAYELRDSGKLSPGEVNQVQEILDWFKKNFPVPGYLGLSRSQRAVCWFTAKAGEPLTKMWRLVGFMEERGIVVRLHKTRDPGQRLYSDAYQVVAIPQGQRRLTHAADGRRHS